MDRYTFGNEKACSALVDFLEKGNNVHQSRHVTKIINNTNRLLNSIYCTDESMISELCRLILSDRYHVIENSTRIKDEKVRSYLKNVIKGKVMEFKSIQCDRAKELELLS